MKAQQQPRTFFASYRFRLRALATTHDMKPEALKSLIDIALCRCDPPTESESLYALLKLAQLKIGLPEINFLFQYSALQEETQERARSRLMSYCNPAKSAGNNEMKILPTHFMPDPDAPVDALCLEAAWDSVRLSTDWTIERCAADYGVPLDVLEGLVCDRFIFRRTGQPPCPIEWFVEEANERRTAEDQSLSP